MMNQRKYSNKFFLRLKRISWTDLSRILGVKPGFFYYIILILMPPLSRLLLLVKDISLSENTIWFPQYLFNYIGNASIPYEYITAYYGVVIFLLLKFLYAIFVPSMVRDAKSYAEFVSLFHEMNYLDVYIKDNFLARKIDEFTSKYHNVANEDIIKYEVVFNHQNHNSRIIILTLFFLYCISVVLMIIPFISGFYSVAKGITHG